MALMEPASGGGGDEDVLAALEASLGDVPEPTDVENVQEIPLLELQDRLSKIDSTLSTMGELRWPRTQQARDLHSTRAALLVELSRRGMR